MKMAFGSSMKSEKEDRAMMMLSHMDVDTARLDRYYSESSYVSRFASDRTVYIIPKKDATLNGSQKWKDTMKEFAQNTMEYLE